MTRTKFYEVTPWKSVSLREKFIKYLRKNAFQILSSFSMMNAAPSNYFINTVTEDKNN